MQECGESAEGASREQPYPLRLLKRDISLDSTSGTRRSSRKSSYTQGSVNGTRWSGNGRLTVMKRRSRIRSNGSGGNQAYGYATFHAPSRQASWNCFRPTGGELVGSKTLNIKKNRQTRPPLPVHASEKAPEPLLSRHYSGFRISRDAEQAVESPSLSDLFTTNLYQRKRDLTQSSGRREGSSSTQGSVHGTRALISSSPADPRHRCIRCVLCPHVSVTPEVTALKDGQRSIWAAVKVSGRLSKLPPKDGATPHNNTPVMTGSFIDHQLGTAAA